LPNNHDELRDDDRTRPPLTATPPAGTPLGAAAPTGRRATAAPVALVKTAVPNPAQELASVRARESRLLTELRQLTRTLEELEAENAQLVALREQLVVAVEELERAGRLRALHEDTLNSLSWRLTRPLRWGIARVRSLRRRS
jgi:hypothetical protein